MTGFHDRARKALCLSRYHGLGGRTGTLNNWIDISEPRLAHNFQTIRNAAGPETTVLAVIKANAYGHGAETCAPMLVRAGATWLGVTCASEGARVRTALLASGGSAAPQPDILIMCGFLPDDVPLIRRHRLTPVLWTAEQVSWLEPEAEGAKSLRVHIEVDTGMGRQGVLPGAPLTALLDRLNVAGLRVDGVFTHFSSAEVAHSPQTEAQRRRFEAVVRQLAEAGVRPTFLHAANSSAVDNGAPAAVDNGAPSAVDNGAPSPDWITGLAAALGAQAMVRTGLALYGYALAIEGSAGDPAPRLARRLQPVLTWKAHVLSVRALSAGETVGYNATFTATRTMRVALLPVGYADGLRRELSSTNGRTGGWAVLRGANAPILGRISMNLTVIDVSEIPEVTPGDEAVVLGEGVTANDHARLASTIAYEILCGIHPCG